jgi:negative regulator of flagellin synthesis FlgM
MVKRADTISMYSFWKIIMSININRQATQKTAIVEQNQAKKQQDVRKQGVENTVKNQDSVQLTSQVKNLNNMKATSEPQVNKQRVETLKAAILNGDYKINTERLAEKLSKFEGEFGKVFA